MSDRGTGEPIAVLGVGCRLPGSGNDPDAFWQILVEGRDVVGPVPKDRWDLDGLYHPDYAAPGRIHQRQGGFVDHVADFDAAFFGISPKEAMRVDPQQRLILETAHQALENAGLAPARLSGSRTGVFVGISSHDYSDIQSAPPEWALIGAHTNQGGAQSIAANRVSYTWNLLGPSLAVDTACSSTLYALHYALASLRNGDCDQALVGGVNALLTAGPTIGFSKGSFLSARGRCQAFSAHADGFVRAEGAAMFVLKPLSNALLDGDPVLAVVRQTAVNEDGRTDGMALPSESAQEMLLRDAYARAGLDPATVGYVEAHGTGTPAGDPIEARAIGSVLGRGRPADRPLYVGSVKTNIGHLEAGAGAASLLKTVLSVQRGFLPASLHADDLNPDIPFDALRMQVVRRAQAWPAWDPARRAGVNGFGFGGANAHAIVEAAPHRNGKRAATAPGPVVATLSARSAEALAALARSHLEHAERPGFDLTDVAHTTVHHRDHHPHRAAVVARDAADWKARLAHLAAGTDDPAVVQGRARGEPGPVGFVCSGQGPQWWAMGRQLLATDPIVRGTVEAIDALFHPIGGWSILDALSRDQASSRIDETQVAQPCLFSLQMALARRWESLGIHAKAVVGHSVGEVASGVLSGALTLDQGVAVIYHRSRVQQKASGAGRMLAVGLSWDDLAPRVARYGDRVSPAAFNRPTLVVLSGDARPLEDLAADLAREEVFHRFVTVAVPFHSHHMDPLKAELDASLGKVAGGPAHAAALYSTVMGDRVGGPELAGDYWFRNVREPVRFVQAIRAMIRDGVRTFVELSPHPILMPGLEDLIAEAGGQGLAVPSMRRDTEEETFLLQSAGRLYAAGHSLAAARPGRFVPVPNSPWERKRYWLESDPGRADRLGAATHPAIRRHRPSAADPTRHSFDLVFDPRVDGWLRDHVVQGLIVVPGAALLEAALACGRAAFGPHVVLADVAIERALFAPSEEDAVPPEVRLEVDGDDGRFRIVGREAGAEWVRHVSGRIDHRGDPVRVGDPDVAEAARRCRPVSTPGEFYPAMATRGLAFGPAFRTLADLAGRADGGRAESLATVVETVPRGAHLVHPTALDACFQALLGAALAAPDAGWRVYLPVGMASVRLSGVSAKGALRARTVVHQMDERWMHGDVWLVDAEGTVLAEVRGFEGKALVGATAGPGAEQYEVRWLPEERPDQWAGRDASAGLGAFSLATDALALGPADPEGLLARSLESLVRGAPPDRLLRILGVGVGAAGLAARLAPVLPDDRVEYVCAVGSDAVAQAREAVAAWPFVRCVEPAADPAHGFAAGTFDVVVSSGLDGADARGAARRLADLLAPGGVLLLADGTPPVDAAVLDEVGFDPARNGLAVVARKRPDAPRSEPENPRTNDLVVLVGSSHAEDLRAVLSERGVRVATVAAEDVAETVAAEPVAAVVFLHAAAEPPGPASDLAAVHLRTTERLRRVALGIARSGRAQLPRLVVVTRGAVAAVASDADVSVGQGLSWGLGRVLASELPEVPVRLVDLSSVPSRAELASLASEALSGAADRDVALRGARRLVARIDRAPRFQPPRQARPDEGYRLKVADPGVLDTLRLETADRRAPGPDEVEVEIRAAGLNFKDLMRAMGLLPRKIAAGSFGLEGSGVVTRVGSNVSVVSVGDEVVVVGSGTFGSHVTTHVGLVARKPAHLDHAEAATLPIAMGTAWYALEYLARVEPGERVLVHSATGGVGHAAIQIALRRGCEVHATAGSEAKRAYLRERLGIANVYDSRSLDFAPQIREATHGKGVDVVLNSLAGAAIPRSLECLGPYGRFVEIGITDLYDNSRLGLGAFRNNLTYAAVDLEHLIKTRPAEFGHRVLAPMMAAVERRELEPLPREDFPMTDVGEMFRRMSRSAHTGKLVAVRDPAAPVRVVPESRPFAARADRTWVVTGGTRGFGNKVAGWLVDRGARHLVLIGASGRVDVEVAEAIDGWRARGVSVRIAGVDVANRVALAAELDAVRAAMPPIGGVVHAAMILDDGPIDQLDLERFLKVLGPKAGGALHLHALTATDPIEQFVMLSSVSELGGNPGQGNYNAANAVLSSLAWHRRLNGRPATTVNLGVVADVGFVAGHAAVARSLDANGLVGNDSNDLLALLGDALRDGATQRALGTVDWEVVGRLFTGVGAFARRLRRSTAAAAQAVDLRTELGALDVAERTARLVPTLRRLVARVVASEVDAVGTDEPLTSLGLDSLMVNQIASWLQAEVGVSVPTMRLLKGPTIEELAADVAGRIAAADKPVVAEAAPRDGLLTIHRAIWHDHLALPGSASVTLVYGLQGTVDADALGRALRGLVGRHDLLNSLYDEKGTLERRPPTAELALARVDARTWADGDLHAAVAQDALVPFDLACELPIRATLYDRGEGRHTLDLRLHHMAYDAVTPFILSEELLALYAAEATGKPHALPPAPTLEAVVAYERTLGGDRDRLRGWWAKRLAGSDLRLPLPHADVSDRADRLMRGAAVPLDPGLGDGLRALAADARTTPFSVLLTGWFLALRDQLGSDDLVIGTTVSLRDRPELQRFVGPAIQFVPLRTNLAGARTFRDALSVVADTVAGALEHRAVPLYDLVEELIPATRRNGRARFGLDSNFHLYDADILARDAVGGNVRRREATEVAGVRFSEQVVPDLPVLRPYDLTCGVWHTAGRYTAGLRHNPKVLEPEQARALAQAFASHLGLAAAGYHRKG